LAWVIPLDLEPRQRLNGFNHRNYIALMHSVPKLSVLLLTVGAMMVRPTIQAADNRPPEGFTALFNGKGLANWKGLLASPNDNPAKRAQLPPDVQETLTRHEAAATTDSAEYLAAMDVFYARHVCRIVPHPAELARTFAAIAEDPTVYHTMNGPSEFHVIGTLKTWSVVDEVKRIQVPTLLISGGHDEAAPSTVQPFADGIPDVRWHIFEQSSHVPHIEERNAYMALVQDFIDARDPS